MNAHILALDGEKENANIDRKRHLRATKTKRYVQEKQESFFFSHHNQPKTNEWT